MLWFLKFLLNEKDESKIEELDKTNDKPGNPFSNLSNANIWDVIAINKNEKKSF